MEKINKWPKPEKGTGLASFLGLCNYYRDLISNFAHISNPLYKVSRSSIVKWTPELNLSFEQLKQQLLEFRIVRMPYPQRDFILETDGSRIAIGAVLKQKFDVTGLEHPVGFYSRSLTGSERNYVAYELEMYAVISAVEYFRMFLLGKEFLLRTDHSALRNLIRRDLPQTTRVKRWILRLSEYTFRIEYQRKQDNVIADVLSRLLFATAEECGATSVSAAQLHLDSKTSATTCDERECLNLRLINLKRDDGFEIESNTDERDTDSDTASIYGMDFSEISEQLCESKAKLCNLDSAMACNFILT